ncbi:MAG: hypothetical protein LBJ93_03660 [Clostridiales bacterium]|jgi:hypothetical protein|nr:hypothetical protein [Clostridiales bacterium]
MSIGNRNKFYFVFSTGEIILNNIGIIIAFSLIFDFNIKESFEFKSYINSLIILTYAFFNNLLKTFVFYPNEKELRSRLSHVLSKIFKFDNNIYNTVSFINSATNSETLKLRIASGLLTAFIIIFLKFIIYKSKLKKLKCENKYQK